MDCYFALYSKLLISKKKKLIYIRYIRVEDSKLYFILFYIFIEDLGLGFSMMLQADHTCHYHCHII